MENNNIFGKRLKLLMDIRGINAPELASKLGVSTQTIYNFISGDRFPRKNSLRGIAEILNISIDYLMGYSDEPSGIKEEEDTQNDIKFIRRAYKEMSKDDQQIILDLVKSIRKKYKKD